MDLNLNTTEEYLTDAGDYAVTKIMLQLYCIPGTRRKSDDKVLKDYTYVIGGLELDAPAAATGTLTAVDLKEAMNKAILKVAEVQEIVSHMLEEHAAKVRASQQLVTPMIRGR